ncbi:hypothetical protein ACVWW4_000743 [Bradyrhizobium sp. LB7.1]
MLDAVHRSLVQDKPDRQRPINAQFEFVAFNVEFNLINLLADRAAKSPNVLAKPDNLTFLSRGELIVRERNCGDAICNLVEGPAGLGVIVTALLDRYRG